METCELIHSHADVFKALHATRVEKVNDNVYMETSDKLHGRSWNRGLFIDHIKSSSVKDEVENVVSKLSPIQPSLLITDVEVENSVKSYLQKKHKITHEGTDTWMTMEKSNFLINRAISTDLDLYFVEDSEGAKSHFKVFNDIFNPEEYNANNYRNLKECSDKAKAEFNLKSASIKSSYENKKVLHFFAKRHEISIGCSTVSFSEDGKTAGLCHLGIKSFYRNDDLKEEGIRTLVNFSLKKVFELGAEKVLFSTDQSLAASYKRMGADVNFSGKIISFDNK